MNRGRELRVNLVFGFFREFELLDGGGAVAEVFARVGGSNGEVRVKQVDGVPSAANILS